MSEDIERELDYEDEEIAREQLSSAMSEKRFYVSPGIEQHGIVDREGRVDTIMLKNSTEARSVEFTLNNLVTDLSPCAPLLAESQLPDQGEHPDLVISKLEMMLENYGPVAMDPDASHIVRLAISTITALQKGPVANSDLVQAAKHTADSLIELAKERCDGKICGDQCCALVVLAGELDDALALQHHPDSSNRAAITLEGAIDEIIGADSIEPHPDYPNELVPWKDGEPLHSFVVVEEYPDSSNGAEMPTKTDELLNGDEVTEVLDLIESETVMPEVKKYLQRLIDNTQLLVLAITSPNLLLGSNGADSD